MGLLLSLLLFSLSVFAYDCVVEKVIDGDTFLCSGERVRLIGVDTPESSLNRRAFKQKEFGTPIEVLSLGARAKAFVVRLIPPGTRVRLEFDIERRDRYGRLLAYVYLPDGRMLNEVILMNGYGSLLTIPPNVKHAERLRRAYRFAMREGRGVWAKPRHERRVEDRYRCGRKLYCSQMSSCEEALFYLRNCGLKRLDGDGDGIPCERLCGR